MVQPDAASPTERVTPPASDNASIARLSLFNRASQAIRNFKTTRRFTVIGTITVSVMFAVLFGLGTWQIMRLQQKNNLIAHITEQLTQPERDLRLRPPTTDADWQALDYRRIVLQGDWLDLHQIKIVPRTYEGENGYHLIVPLHLPNGQIILVNRGWVPDKTELGPTSQTQAVIVAGIVRLTPAEKPFGMMDNSPHRNQWAWPDTTAIAQAIGVAHVAPIMLYAERAVASPDNAINKADEYPIGGQAALEIRNEHKQYALTWYALALVLVVIWLMASRTAAIKDAAIVADATSTD